MTPDPIAARARELAGKLLPHTTSSQNVTLLIEALQAERERALEECAGFADMLASQYEAEEKQACTLNIRASDSFPAIHKAKHWRILEAAIRALAAKKAG